MGHAGWIKDSINPERLDLVSNFLAEEINKDKEELGINSIAVTGLSGLVIGGLVSVKTNLPLILVRKDGEDKHSSYEVEFTDDLKELNYCIVDDLVSSGDTLKRIINKININGKDHLTPNKLKKIYLYKQFDDCIEGKDVIIELNVPVYAFYSDDRIIKYLFDTRDRRVEI